MGWLHQGVWASAIVSPLRATIVCRGQGLRVRVVGIGWSMACVSSWGGGDGEMLVSLL